MFKKSERLNRIKFTEYFKRGQRFHSENFTLIFTPAPLRSTAVVVGKKVFKSAVDRNTLRRRVYAAIRSHLERDGTTSGIYIIISKPNAKHIAKSAIVIELGTLLASVGKPR